MPQLQNLVLTDRAAPPVAHTFTPRDIRGNVGTVEESTGVKVGDKAFSISVRETTPKGKFSHCEVRRPHCGEPDDQQRYRADRGLYEFRRYHVHF